VHRTPTRCHARCLLVPRGICHASGPAPVTLDDGQQNIAFLLGRAYLGFVPKIFEKDGFQFAFYSNDHRPIHVHVRKGGGEAIFDVEKRVELRESAGMKVRELARAEELAKDNRKLIIEACHEHLC
jgi:hypothetical protein